MYLSIPKGMIYEQCLINGVLTDFFIDERASDQGSEFDEISTHSEVRAPINIQALVKEALRKNYGQYNEINLGDFILYLKKPTFCKDDEYYLKYTPNHNGKYAATDTAVVTGRSIQEEDPKSYRSTRYGTLWYQVTPLGSKRTEEVLIKREEQKENRRHNGDSPCST